MTPSYKELKEIAIVEIKNTKSQQKSIVIVLLTQKPLLCKSKSGIAQKLKNTHEQLRTEI